MGARVVTEKMDRQFYACAECGGTCRHSELAQLPDSGGWRTLACPACHSTQVTKMKAKTYDEWRELGYYVQKGQKATGRNREGIPTFTREQVEDLNAQIDEIH